MICHISWPPSLPPLILCLIYHRHFSFLSGPVLSEGEGGCDVGETHSIVLMVHVAVAPVPPDRRTGGARNNKWYLVRHKEWKWKQLLTNERQESRSYVLISHGVKLFKLLGPVSGFFLWNVCKTHHNIHRVSLGRVRKWANCWCKWSKPRGSMKLDWKTKPSGNSKRVSSSSLWNVGSLVPQISFSAMITLESRVSHWPGPSCKEHSQQ